MKRTGLIIFLYFILHTLYFILVNPVHAATYYIAPDKDLDGSVPNVVGDDNNPGTLSQPWKSFDRHLNARTYSDKVLQPGDTLILIDGIYYQSIHPFDVKGQPGSPITIRAQTDGKATIDGQGLRIPVLFENYRQAHYLVIEGIVARNSLHSVYVVTSDNNVFRRVSGYDANTDANAHVFGISGDYNLVEDCVASGKGRKMAFVYQGEHNVFRRCFADWREWDGRNWCGSDYPWGEGLEIYGGNYNIIENSIAYSRTSRAGISLLAQGPQTANNNKILGTMSIFSGMKENGTPMLWGPDPNNPPLTQVQPLVRPGSTSCTGVQKFDAWPSLLSGFRIGGSGTIINNVLQDIFSWGSARYGLTLLKPTPDAVQSNNRLNHATIVNNGLDNIAKWGGVGAGAYQSELSLLSSIENSKIDTVWQGGSSYTSINGEGARLIYRYVDGELMDGANGKQAQLLWPWPMEERIQNELGYSVTNTMIPILTDAEVPHGYNQTIPTPSPTIQPPKPGDTDSDGDVDISDLSTLLATFGSTGSGLLADFDSDGDVDISDLSTLLASFGS